MGKIPEVKLSSGHNMPAFGLGTFKTPNSTEGKEAVKTAIKVGYRLIDTACAYQNEGEIGCAIKELESEGIINRKDLFISTKLWCTDNSPELVRDAVHRSLTKLQTDYIDLYLLHWPLKFLTHKKRDLDDYSITIVPPDEDKFGYDKNNIDNVWKELEKLVEEGKLKSIGVCNFSIPKLKKLYDGAKIKPTINQVECHPYFSQNEMISFCEKHSIKLMAWYPLGGDIELKDMPRLINNPILIEMSKKINKSTAQICLRWAIQRGEIIIPKSIHKDRIIENNNIFDFILTDDDMNIINKLNTGKRTSSPDFFYPSGVDVKKLLWDE